MRKTPPIFPGSLSTAHPDEKALLKQIKAIFEQSDLLQGKAPPEILLLSHYSSYARLVNKILQHEFKGFNQVLSLQHISPHTKKRTN